MPTARRFTAAVGAILREKSIPKLRFSAYSAKVNPASTTGSTAQTIAALFRLPCRAPGAITKRKAIPIRINEKALAGELGENVSNTLVSRAMPNHHPNIAEIPTRMALVLAATANTTDELLSCRAPGTRIPGIPCVAGGIIRQCHLKRPVPSSRRVLRESYLIAFEYIQQRHNPVNPLVGYIFSQGFQLTPTRKSAR